jgi:hypothetical protein
MQVPPNSAEKGSLVPAPWRDLQGPSRTLAISATILLVACALGAIEAAVMLILGPARDIVLKPFVILGYIEACAILFSAIFIVLSIIGVIFYYPYLVVREKIFVFRARRAPQVTDQHTWFEPAYKAPGHYRDEDGAPD